jgi:tetratricopeptide (TPR) repeat protein
VGTFASLKKAHRVAHVVRSGRSRAASVVLFLAVPSAVAAEPSSVANVEAEPSPSDLERAKALQAQGVVAFREGNYAAAIDAFVAADRCVPSAALSFNVAKAHDRLGDVGQSLFWYTDYLRRAPEAEDAAQTRASIAERESRLAGQGTQLLIVRTNPQGATVTLDGTHVCQSPCATVTVPGVHSLELTHEAHLPVSVRVEVALARLTEAHFDLVRASHEGLKHAPLPKPTAPQDVAPLPAAVTPKATQPAAQDSTPEPSLEPQSGNRWTFVTLIAGGVGVVVAGGLELVRRDAQSDVEVARVQLDKQAAIERMDQAMWGARVAGGLGGALLLTSGVLWWLDSGDAARAPEVASTGPTLTPILTPSQAGLQFSVTRDLW